MLSKDDLMNRSIGKVLQHLGRLMSRAAEGATNWEQAFTMVKIAQIRSLLDKKGKLQLDSRKICNEDNLRKALEAWESPHVSFVKEDTYRRSYHVLM